MDCRILLKLGVFVGSLLVPGSRALVKMHLCWNPRWRTAPKFSVLNRYNIGRGLFNFAEIWWSLTKSHPIHYTVQGQRSFWQHVSAVISQEQIVWSSSNLVKNPSAKCNMWHMFNVIRSNRPEIQIWQIFTAKKHPKTLSGRQIIAFF